MATSVVMPALEMAQETGKLVSWLKQEGDRVAKGELLLEVETDKAVVEVEAAADGILAAVTAKVGDVVPVGRTIAWLVQPGETPPTGVAAAGSGRRMDSPVATAASSSAGVPDIVPPSGVKISPKARRMAKEHGVDVSHVRGSGPGGEVLADDILKAAAAASSAAGSVQPQPDRAAGATRLQPGAVPALSAIARLMAERTTESWTTVPHFFVTRDIEATSLVRAREWLAPSVERDKGVKLTQTDLLVALVGRTLVRHPRLNASWADDRIRPNADVHVALAVAVDDGVVAAVVRHADRAGLGDIAIRRHELADRARANRLQPADLAGATFTISNLGMYGVDAFTAIIVPPQAAILAVGAIGHRAVAEEDRVVVRPMVTLTVSCDHRVVDGARAAAFLKDLAAAMADPETVLR